MIFISLDRRDIEGCQIPEHLQSEISMKKWCKAVLKAREEIKIAEEDTMALYQFYLEVYLNQ